MKVMRIYILFCLYVRLRFYFVLFLLSKAWRGILIHYRVLFCRLYFLVIIAFFLNLNLIIICIKAFFLNLNLIVSYIFLYS